MTPIKPTSTSNHTPSYKEREDKIPFRKPPHKPEEPKVAFSDMLKHAGEENKLKADPSPSGMSWVREYILREAIEDDNGSAVHSCLMNFKSSDVATRKAPGKGENPSIKRSGKSPKSIYHPYGHMKETP